jgi:hypothetical protein
MLDGALSAGKAAQHHLVQCLALRIVCLDLRSQVFERLYKFHVASSRLDPVLKVLTLIGMVVVFLLWLYTSSSAI